MTRTIVTREIHAPLRTVFDTVSKIENFRKAIPDIEEVEFLSEQRSGVGTRFRETRNMNGRRATVELEVTEYEPDDHVRLVSDAGGTVWDTVFSVTEIEGPATRLEMVMDANAYKLLAKLFNPLFKGMIRKYIEKDMDAVKAHCEAAASSS